MADTYTLRHPVKGIPNTLTLRQPTLRTFSAHGQPYSIARNPGRGGDVEVTLTANYNSFLNFLADMTGHPKDALANIDAADLAVLLAMLLRMTQNSPALATQLADEFLFNSILKWPKSEVDQLTIPEALDIRNRAIEYNKKA
jgi:hypothetical protein